MRATVPDVTASAELIAHTWGAEIVLTGDGFRPDAVHRVVVRDRSGAAVDAGAFIGTGAQRMTCNLNSSVRPSDAAGFQVLDAEGTVIVIGQL